MHFETVTAAASVGGPDVTLNGGFVFAFDLFIASAGWRFTNTGTVFSNSRGILTQVHADTDWIFPRTTFDNTDYEIRVHRITGNSAITGDLLDIFIVLNVTREWLVSCNAFCIEANSFVMDIRFQDGTDLLLNNQTSLFDGANVMASAIYSAEIEADGFF